MSGVTVVGHRGVMAHEPENSLQSYALAERIGVDEIELDVRITRDGVLVVNHDATLDRLVADPARRGQPPLAEMTLAEAQAVTLDSGRGVLTLEEAYRATRTTIQCEIKDPACVPELARFLAGAPEWAERTMVTGFDAGALSELGELLPDQERGIIVHRYPSGDEEAERIIHVTGSSRFHCGWEGLTAEAVARMHACGRDVHAWPVRSYQDVVRVVELGVDGFTSDDPETALAWYERARAAVGV